MSLQEFRDYVTNSGVNFDILTIEQKREWREMFDRSRPDQGNYPIIPLLLISLAIFIENLPVSVYFCL